MCFKHGRITVPPKIALAVSGFSLSEGQFSSLSASAAIDPVEHIQLGRGETGSWPTLYVHAEQGR